MAKSDEESKPKSPPLRVDSTLHLAWGLTLFLSSDEKQQKIAEGLKLSEILKSDGSTHTEYLDNLKASISAYLRRMGFEKEEYDSFLDAQRESLKTVTKYWNDLGTMTSFSTESTIMKVTSFLGFGTSGEHVIKWLHLFTKSVDEDTISNAGKSGTEEVTKNAVPLFSQLDIGFILIFGAIGLIGTITFLKWFGNEMIERKTKSVKKEQQDYWKKTMRRRYEKALIHLYKDIQILVEKYYSDYTEAILDNDTKSDPEHSKKLANIINEILPEEIIYYPFLPTEGNGK